MMWLFIWAASVIATSAMAAAKNRNTIAWFFMGLFFGPLAILLIFVSPAVDPNRRTEYHPAPIGSVREEFEALKRDFEVMRRRLDNLGTRITALSPTQEAPPAAVPQTAPVQEAPIAPAPSPQELEHAVTTKKTPPKSDIETDLGRFWLNKIGIIIFSLGIAFLLTYSFAHFGPVAKICAGYMIALGLFIGGIKLEKNEITTNYGKVLLGGAWAITYFTTYAMYHFKASQIITSEALNLCLLAIVAFGIIVHSLRYKSEALTAMALLIGYLTSVLGDIGTFTLASAGILACVVLATVYKMGWIRLIFLGILATYLTHAVWVAKQIAGIDIPFQWWSIRNVAFFFDMAFLSIYWALFTAAIHIVRDRDPATEKKLAAANMANFLLFFLMAFPKIQASYPENAFNIVFGLGLIYMAVATIMQIVRRNDLFISNVLIAVSLLTFSLPLRFLPYHSILIWFVELPFLICAGFMFERRIYRYMGLGLAFFLLLRVLIGNIPVESIVVLGKTTTWEVVLQFLGFLSSAACYALYYIFAKKKDAAAPDASFRSVFGLLGTGYLTLYAWSVIDPRSLTLAISIESLLLFVAGILLLDRTLRAFALWVLAIAAARYLFWDRFDTTQNAYPLLAMYGLLLSTFGQYAINRWATARSLLETSEGRIGKGIFFGGTALCVVAILDYASPDFSTVCLGALSLCIMWWGTRISDKAVRLCALITLVFAAARFFFFENYTGLAPLVLWSLITAKIACAWAVYFMVRDLAKRARLDAEEKSLLGPLFALCTGLIVFAILDQVPDAWVSVSLGITGVALFAAGFLIKEKIFRVAGFIIFGLTLGKVVLVDLAELAIIYKIISFTIIGALFLGVSYVYTRTTPNQPSDRG